MTEKTARVRNTAGEEVGVERDQDVVNVLPDGLMPLATFQDNAASELLEMAERHVSEAREKLGPQSSKPRLDRIHKLFAEKAGTAPRVEPDLNRLIGSASLKAQLANYESIYHHALAIASNDFDKVSIHSGAALQCAYDDWTLAVNIYRSQMRSAGSVLEAETETPLHASAQSDYEGSARVKPQVDHYDRATDIGDAVLKYEKVMQKSGTDLAACYGRLISEVYEAVTSLAAAEANLIAVSQNTHRVFWRNVQGLLSQLR